MSYTQENFQEWIFYIGDKMDSFTEDFAHENNLILDYSIQSLDDIEKWIIKKYKDEDELIEDHKILDLLTIYIGETLRKHIGGKWAMDTENEDNAFYMMPVLTSPDFKGVKYKSPMTYATASIDRQQGNYISTILKNNMNDMSIPIKES
ncbi:hypothetical protein IQ37_13335 [Chryseobacterium piperi]|uniref:DUF3806 domain-containing protein n=1 Tax=Chryseobacterium piperi TaxID=558152 RepID=A0A086B617_9FLAO|nr:hypothetical protein [Chryseobacterium piperi]ASW74469.1 hypothetical protein CJF12_09370 [Chryseobacterium piperi]KFF24381.1 hypothetical protein IQ37_13335 [Chryseobacterium piperi]